MAAAASAVTSHSRLAWTKGCQVLPAGASYCHYRVQWEGSVQGARKERHCQGQGASLAKHCLPLCRRPAAAALFATGWPYEGDCGPEAPACWRQRDAHFWSCIARAWRAGGAGVASADASAAAAAAGGGGGGVVRRLPLRSNFSPGCGLAMYQAGRQVSSRAWYNLSLQSLQPLLRVCGGGGSSVGGQPIDGSTGSGTASTTTTTTSTTSSGTVQADISYALAFSGGSSLRLSGSLGPGQCAAVQLFQAAMQLPAAGLWVRLTASASNGVEARLALRLVAPSGNRSSRNRTGSTSSIELLPVLSASAAAGDDGSAPAAQAPVASSHGAVELAACACSRIACAGPAGAELEAGAAEAAGSGSVGAAPDWVTRHYCLGPATLAAAALPGDGDGGAGALLAGIDLLLMGSATVKDPAAHAFQLHLGGQPACLPAHLPSCPPAASGFALHQGSPLPTTADWLLNADYP